MKYITIDEAKNLQDRVRIYFGINSEFETEFAAKQSVNGEITSIKAKSINDIFTWLGFSDLAFSLFNSPKFQTKYKPEIISIIDHTLYVVMINEESFFFFCHNNEWVWTDVISDLMPSFGQDIAIHIDNVAGKDFCKRHEVRLCESTKVDSNLKQTLIDLKNLKEKAAALKAKNENKALEESE